MINILLIFSIFLLLYTYIGYFLLIFVLGKFFKKKIVKKNIFPSITLMIAAYNEENDIQQKLENSLLLNYPKNKLKIVVVSDASTDNTDYIVSNFNSEIISLFRVEGRVGKTQARNIAMKKNSSEITVFSDATTIYKQDVLLKLVRNFADKKVGMVTGHLKYQNPSSCQVGTGQKVFWNYESCIKINQTYLGTLSGAVGCLSAIRTELYTTLPANVIEDLTLPLFMILKKFRVVFEEEAICYEKTTSNSKQEWNMRVRVIRGGITGLLFAKQVLNPFRHPIVLFQLFSHKILRWTASIQAIFLFIISILASLNSNCVGEIILTFQIVFYLVVFLAYFLEKKGIHNRILAIPLYFFLLNAASLVAIIKVFTDELEANWETQR